MAAHLTVCTSLLCLVALAMANSCPTWFTNSTGHCKCGNELNGYVKCDEDTYRVDVRMGWCIMLFSNRSDIVVAGACPYNYASNSTSRMYSLVPSDPTQLNAEFCGHYNHEGLFCGRCIEGFGPSSFPSKFCVNCSVMKLTSAISFFIFFELFPITILFFIVVIFHLKVTSGPMLGYIIYCHAHVITLHNNSFMYSSILLNLSSFLTSIFHTSLVLADIWTLGFFQFIVSPFCISEEMTGIHVHMLRFGRALYPQCLVLLTYIVMELHLHDSKCISMIRKPYYMCLAKLKGKMNGSNSIIHAFATFIFLSLSGVTYET